MVQGPVYRWELPPDLQALIAPPIEPLPRAQVEQRLNDVNGTPSSEKAQIDQAILKLRRIQAIVRPILAIAIIGYSGIAASIAPHAFSVLCLHTMPPLLAFFITCKTVAFLFNLYLVRTTPKYDDYLAYQAKQHMRDSPEVAMQFRKLVTDIDIKYNTSLNAVANAYDVYLVRQADEQMPHSPERAILFARFISPGRLHDNCIARIEPSYDIYCDRQVDVCLAQYENDNALYNALFTAHAWEREMTATAQTACREKIARVENLVARVENLVLAASCFGYALNVGDPQYLALYLSRMSDPALRAACERKIEELTPDLPHAKQVHRHFRKGRLQEALKAAQQISNPTLQAAWTLKIEREKEPAKIRFMTKHLAENPLINSEDFQTLSKVDVMQITCEPVRNDFLRQLNEAHNRWIVHEIDKNLLEAPPGENSRWFSPSRALEHAQEITNPELQQAQIARIHRANDTDLITRIEEHVASHDLYKARQAAESIHSDEKREAWLKHLHSLDLQ